MTAALVAGCSRPRFEGPQIQDPPPNFLYDANAYQGRNVFPEREQLRQSAWARGFGEDTPHSSIYMTAYAGPSTRADVQAARDAQQARYGRSIRYGDLEDLVIDGRPAWGWLETQIYQERVASLEYKAVVSYDTVSYAVEFWSNDPAFMDPATLQATVETFAIGKTRVSVVGVVVAIVLLAAGVLVWRRQRRLAAA
jgi:hypothetical protein